MPVDLQMQRRAVGILAALHEVFGRQWPEELLKRRKLEGPSKAEELFKARVPASLFDLAQIRPVDAGVLRESVMCPPVLVAEFTNTNGQTRAIARDTTGEQCRKIWWFGRWARPPWHDPKRAESQPRHSIARDRALL